jgi:transcriptional/translational regulatory protein YebC/TACO1
MSLASDGNFCRVLESFKATLSQDDKDEFKLSTLDDLKLEILAIQEKQASERKMKNSARLKSFLEAMEQYDEVVKVFLNASEILAFIWVRQLLAILRSQ